LVGFIVIDRGPPTADRGLSEIQISKSKVQIKFKKQKLKKSGSFFCFDIWVLAFIWHLNFDI